jgi:hypothetical protein
MREGCAVRAASSAHRLIEFAECGSSRVNRLGAVMPERGRVASEQKPFSLFEVP